MKLTLEPTGAVVLLDETEGEMPVRVWRGVSDSGCPVFVYIALVAVPDTATPEQQAEFARELIEIATLEQADNARPN